MKAAEIDARLVEIIANGKQMRDRAVEFAKQVPSDIQLAAECGGIRATLEHLIEDLEQLHAQARGKR